MCRVLLLLFFLCSFARAEERPAALRDLTVSAVPGAQLPLGEMVVGEDGRSVPLESFFDGRRPVLLVLTYYGCPMLCGLVLKNLNDGLRKIAGDGYRVLALSIDPHESAELAAEKKRAIGGAGGGHFLVGKSGSEKRIADAVGFRYRWDPATRSWAHGAAVFVVSPGGKLTQVLFGLDYSPSDLRLALVEAGQGKVAAIADRVLLFCYQFGGEHGEAAVRAMRLVRVGGAVTVLALVALVWGLRKRAAMRLQQ